MLRSNTIRKTEPLSMQTWQIRHGQARFTGDGMGKASKQMTACFCLLYVP